MDIAETALGTKTMPDGNMRLTRRRFCSATGGALLLPIVSKAQAEPESTTVRYFQNSFSPALGLYLTEVIAMVLEKSAAEYGPHKLELFDSVLSPSRIVLEVERGKMMDITFGSSWDRGRFIATSLLQLEYPVLFGLLGLRSLIVNSDRHTSLKHITHAGHLKALSFGQGADWPDSSILRHNGLQVVEAQNFESLFPMLSKGRFDLLPLSVLEIEKAMARFRAEHPKLAISAELRCFYPMELHLLVNPRRPLLAERLARGLQLALTDGALQRLFDRHFQQVNESIDSLGGKLVLLENPLISKPRNQSISERFLELHGHKFEVLA